MATFRREKTGYIYLYHWLTPTRPLKVSTRIKIDETGWNKKKSRPKDIEASFQGKTIIKEMRRYEYALNKALNKLSTDNVQLVREEVYKQLNGAQNGNTTDFLAYFKAFVTEYKEGGRSNWKAYNTCYNHLSKYFDHKPVPYSILTLSFYDKYNKHLVKRELATNTIATQWKLIKAVLAKAQKEGLHNNDSFRHFKKKMEKADTIFLSQEELTRMMSKNLTGHLEKARDYFIIGAFTGLRFDDWNRVRRDNIKDGILSIRTTKTDEVSIIPVHPYVRTILDKYNGILPPKPSNQKMNDYIKVVAAYAKIDEDVETRITRGGKKVVTLQKKHQLVTTHTARRSLATNLIIEGVSPFVVMKVTGHRTLSSFEKYVRLGELQAMIELKSLSFFQ